MDKLRSFAGLIKHDALPPVLIFLVSFAAFIPSLGNDFVWDDIKVISEGSSSFKQYGRDFMLIPKIQERKKERYYRPLASISLAMDKTFWGLSPSGFHLSNIILHSAASILFYLLVILILQEFGVERKKIIALLSSLLFALHPMHVESVSWISGRTDVLAAVFFFLAFIFYILSYQKWGFLFLSALCFFLSLLSKEVAIAFPLVALAFDLTAGRYKSRVNLAKYSVCLIILLIYLYVRGRAFILIPEISEARVGQTVLDQGLQIWGVLKVILSSYLFYISRLVWPFNFNAFIGTVPGGFYYLFFSIVTMLFLFIISFMSIKRGEGVAAFCIFWVFITIAPSNIIAVTAIASTPLAERYLYIPSAGYCMLAGYLLLEMGRKANAQRKALVIASVLVICYLFCTIYRQAAWKDNLTLWEDTSRKSSGHFMVHLNYGAALKDEGKNDEAIRQLLHIVEDPGVVGGRREKCLAANNIGLAYLDKRDLNSAEKWFHKAVDYDPEFGASYYQLGFIYFVRGDPDRAETWFRKAIEHDPRNAKSYYHLGAIYYIRGEYQNSRSSYLRAEKYLKKAVRLSPSGKSYFVLSRVYVGLGKMKKARQHAKLAVQSGLSEELQREAQGILTGSEW